MSTSPAELDPSGIARAYAVQVLTAPRLSPRDHNSCLERLCVPVHAEGAVLLIWDQQIQTCYPIARTLEGSHQRAIGVISARAQEVWGGERAEYTWSDTEMLLLPLRTDTFWQGALVLLGPARLSERHRLQQSALLMAVALIHRFTANEAIRQRSDLARTKQRFERAMLQLEQQQLQAEQMAAELEQTNLQLEESMQELKRTQDHLIHASREAGMAEVATGILHNVGNALNSINISVLQLSRLLSASGVSRLVQIGALLEQNVDDLPGFFSPGQPGVRLVAYLQQLTERLLSERQLQIEELDQLQTYTGHVKTLISRQQTYARSRPVIERCSLPTLLNDAVGLAGFSSSISLEVPGSLPEVLLDRHRILQILVNLLSNAQYAVQDVTDPQICLSLRLEADTTVVLEVSDNGVGITEDTQARLFQHGFTTRPDGHGFGLHNSALAAKAINGSLRARSAGAGQGATFTLEFPFQQVES